MHLYLKDGRVKMYSDGEIEAPSLTQIKINLTQEEIEKLSLNCPATWNGEKLEFGEPTIMTSAEEQARKTLVYDLKEEVDKLADKKTITKEDLLKIFNSIAA